MTQLHANNPTQNFHLVVVVDATTTGSKDVKAGFPLIERIIHRVYLTRTSQWLIRQRISALFRCVNSVVIVYRVPLCIMSFSAIQCLLDFWSESIKCLQAFTTSASRLCPVWCHSNWSRDFIDVIDVSWRHWQHNDVASYWATPVDNYVTIPSHFARHRRKRFVILNSCVHPRLIFIPLSTAFSISFRNHWP